MLFDDLLPGHHQYHWRHLRDRWRELLQPSESRWILSGKRAVLLWHGSLLCRQLAVLCIGPEPDRHMLP
ncbi:MAG: hypothetical protein KC432_11725 [Thermomicrobiales bacterium]|nr:hypothetical protein [Thermomicrobiales bacterium]